jgi:uncharacterized protein (TIGR02186 family)
LILIFATAASFAQALVVALSADQIAITSSFTGVDITVFGALELARPAEGAQLVVVLRGPEQSVTARRKERVLGLWIVRSSETFADVPAFYAIHATAPLAEIADESVLADLGLGIDTVIPAELGGNRYDFAQAIVRLQVADGRFVEETGTVDRPSSTLFRTKFALPANISVGDYTVDVLLFNGGRLVATADEKLEIVRAGAEQFLFEASRDQSWLYALTIVAIAIFAGWLGGVLFRRD